MSEEWREIERKQAYKNQLLAERLMALDYDIRSILNELGEGPELSKVRLGLAELLAEVRAAGKLLNTPPEELEWEG